MSSSNRSSASNPRRTSVRVLPLNPSVENLRKQAKRLAAADTSLTLQQAQHRLATEYGCEHWAALLERVEQMTLKSASRKEPSDDKRPLPAAANRNDIAGVRAILAGGEFTQRDLDLALARCVLRLRERRAIAELLLEHGADPDAEYGGNYGPIALVTGECLDPDGLEFLIDKGADVTFPPFESKYGPTSMMISTLGAYMRGANERKHRCIEILLKHNAPLPAEITPAMFAIHRGDTDALSKLIDADRSLVTQHFAQMLYGNISLRGATLLHLAVEFGEIECIDLLIRRGADVNARAEPIDGIGDQTPVFHAVAACTGSGLPVLEHLLKRPKVDLSVKASFRAIRESMVPTTPALTPLEWARFSQSDDTMSWRRASAREIELLASASAG